MIQKETSQGSVKFEKYFFFFGGGFVCFSPKYLRTWSLSPLIHAGVRCAYVKFEVLVPKTLKLMIFICKSITLKFPFPYCNIYWKQLQKSCTKLFGRKKQGYPTSNHSIMNRLLFFFFFFYINSRCGKNRQISGLHGVSSSISFFFFFTFFWSLHFASSTQVLTNFTRTLRTCLTDRSQTFHLLRKQLLKRKGILLWTITIRLLWWLHSSLLMIWLHSWFLLVLHCLEKSLIWNTLGLLFFFPPNCSIHLWDDF